MSLFLTAPTNQFLFSFAHRLTPAEPLCRIQEHRRDSIYCPHVEAYLAAAGENGSTLSRLITYKSAMMAAKAEKERFGRECSQACSEKTALRPGVAYMARHPEFTPEIKDSNKFFTFPSPRRDYDRDNSRAYRDWKIRWYRANFASQLNDLGRPYDLDIYDTEVKTVLSFFNRLEMTLLKHFVARDAPERVEDVDRMAHEFLEREIVLLSEKSDICCDFSRRRKNKRNLSGYFGDWVNPYLKAEYPASPCPSRWPQFSIGTTPAEVHASLEAEFAKWWLSYALNDFAR